MDQSSDIPKQDDQNINSSDSFEKDAQIHDCIARNSEIRHLHFPKTQNQYQQEEEEKRITQVAREFNVFLKEALDGCNLEEPDDRLFQADVSSIRQTGETQNKFTQEYKLNKMEGIGAQQIYSNDKNIREAIFKLKRILNEEEQLLQNFIMLSKALDLNDKISAKRIKDYFEAFQYETAIRSKDKQKLYDEVLLQEEKLLNHIRDSESKYRKLEKDYTSIKKFHEVRSLRQTGRFKGNPTNLQKVKPSPTSSSDTLVQRFLTENTIQKTQGQLLPTEDTVNKSNAITSVQNNHNNQNQQVQLILQQKNNNNTKDQEIVIDETSVYDWIVDIDLITSVAKEGWKVYLSKKFADAQVSSDICKHTNSQDSQGIQQQFLRPQPNYGFGHTRDRSGWDGATVAVVGLYDKGKTFVLNNLTQSNLPSGKKVNTKGISFKNVNVDSGTHLILVDTAGSYSPVKIQNELSIVEKEATEMFITDLVFEISDYFICVVNDFTSLDQRYLDRLSRNLQNSPNKTFREIIVVHNLKEVESPEILEHVWSTQVTQIYQNGSIQRTKVAAVNPVNGQLQEKHVLWFKTQYTRHVCLVNDDSYLGMAINQWVFSLLRYWLKAVFVPVNRPFSVVDSIITFSKVKLSQYFRTNLSLKIHDTEDGLVKTIITEQEIVDNVRIPQVSIDSSGLIMARPDSFLPATDIIATDKYIIYMDVPGLTKDEIIVYRQNVVTIIKGIRKKPYSEVKNEKLEKSERKYGEFALSFKIPEIYERKWSLFSVENGVLTIVYEKDKDDQIIRSKHREKEDGQK